MAGETAGFGNKLAGFRNDPRLEDLFKQDELGNTPAEHCAQGKYGGQWLDPKAFTLKPEFQAEAAERFANGDGKGIEEILNSKTFACLALETDGESDPGNGALKEWRGTLSDTMQSAGYDLQEQKLQSQLDAVRERRGALNK